MACRACGGSAGGIVLDLGEQPACDYFPPRGTPGPDPSYPLQMWLCSSCGLAQLMNDPTMPEEPKAAEPAALRAQAADAVRRVGSAGWLPPGATVIEYGSPHGGSWLELLVDRGLVTTDGPTQAGIVLDCFGLMHCADQKTALAERASRVSDRGVLLVQYHSLATIIQHGQWNALRHGHFAYYSAPALVRMLAGVGFTPCAAWRFDLYQGTFLLAATRAGHDRPDGSVEALLAEERKLGVEDPAVVMRLQQDASRSAAALRRWLSRQRAAGRTVLGYGAASRAVALLCSAGVDADLLPAVADASAAKQGCRMPGTDIPVISPADLLSLRPDAVVVFLTDLVEELRVALPEVEAEGGTWVTMDHIVGSPR